MFVSFKGVRLIAGCPLLQDYDKSIQDKMKTIIRRLADFLYLSVARMGALTVGESLTAKDIERWKEQRT